MAVSAKNLIGGGNAVEIGEAVFLPNNNDSLLTMGDMVFLKSGSIMTAPPLAGYEDTFNSLAIPVVTGTTGAQAISQQQFTIATAFGNGMHVLFEFANDGTSSSYLYCNTTDGILQRRNVLPQDWRWCAKFANGRFVCLGQKTYVTSTDGLNWSSSTGLVNSSVYGIDYGNGTWVGVYNTGQIVTSLDGITWALKTTNLTNTSSPGCMAFGNGLFLIGSNNSNSNVYYTSPDGINWTARTFPLGSGAAKIAFGNGVFCAAVHGAPGFATSTDGINWVYGVLPQIMGTTLNIATNNANYLNFGDGMFVISYWLNDTDYRYFATSVDGYSWIYQPIQFYSNSYRPRAANSVGNGIIFTGNGTNTQFGTQAVFYKKAIGIPTQNISNGQILAVRIK